MKYAIIGLVLLAGCEQSPSPLEKRVDELERLTEANTNYINNLSYRMNDIRDDLRDLDRRLSQNEPENCYTYERNYGWAYSNDCTREPDKTCLLKNNNCK